MWSSLRRWLTLTSGYRGAQTMIQRVSYETEGKSFLIKSQCVCNIKQRICSLVALINASNFVKVLLFLTQGSFFSPFNMTDHEGRSREPDGPHHATLGPGSSGACASQWGRCWWSLSSCLWVWDGCSRWRRTLDFHKPVNYSTSCGDQHFGAASWWAGRPLWEHLNLRPWKLSNQFI